MNLLPNLPKSRPMGLLGPVPARADLWKVTGRRLLIAPVRKLASSSVNAPLPQSCQTVPAMLSSMSGEEAALMLS